MELVAVGKTKKVNGIQGFIKVDIQEKYLEDFLAADVVFLKKGGSPLPYFVEEFQVTNAPLIKFEEVDSKEAATQITNHEIYLRDQDILPDAVRTLEVVEEAPEFAEYLNYTIHDQNDTAIGKIKEIVEMPQQELALVEYNENEIYIPLFLNAEKRLKFGTKKTRTCNLHFASEGFC